jgi:hypothetical protein
MADIRTTPTLSGFVGADEDPISDSGRWLASDTGVWVPAARKGNKLTNSNTGTLGFSSWQPNTYDDNSPLELWGLATGGGGGAGGEGWRMGFYQQGTGDGAGAGTIDGYSLVHFSAGSPLVIIRRYTNGGFTALASVGVGFLGGYFYFKRDGNNLEFWESADAVTWTQILTATDSTYHGAFRLALGAEDQGFGQICSWDHFGGGSSGNNTTLPQIIRRPSTR